VSSTVVGSRTTRRAGLAPALARIGHVAVGIWLAFLAPAVASGADERGELKRLFELGAQGTPSAVAAAKAQYEKLRDSHRRDRRIDYAFAAVLVNQRQYRDAVALLSEYLEAGHAELGAHALKMRAQLPLRAFNAVLEEARILAERFPRDPKARPEEVFREAAHFLGTIFAYLELVRPAAVDATLRSRDEEMVLRCLGEVYGPDFAAGRRAVAKRFAELQAQGNINDAEWVAKVEARKEQDKSLADDAQVSVANQVQIAQASQGRLQEIQRDYLALQAQLAPYVSQRANLRALILATEGQVEALRRARNPDQTLETNLRQRMRTLDQQVHELDQQFEPQRSAAAALEREAARYDWMLMKAEVIASKNDRVGSDAKARVRRADEKLSSPRGTLEGKGTLFSSYAPFVYEQEHRRVLGWFAR
jgi:hypothetical protein